MMMMTGKEKKEMTIRVYGDLSNTENQENIHIINRFAIYLLRFFGF